MANTNPDTSGLIPFQKGQSGNLAGRPPKIYSVLKKTGYSKEDIKAAFEEIGFQTIGDLKQILADDTKPVLLHVVAKAFIKARSSGDMRYVTEILSWTLGRPKQEVESKINLDYDITLVVDPNPPRLPSQEERELIHAAQQRLSNKQVTEDIPHEEVKPVVKQIPEPEKQKVKDRKVEVYDTTPTDTYRFKSGIS